MRMFSLKQEKSKCVNIKEEKEMRVSKELLEILACPKCKGAVDLAEDESGLICQHCKLKYPIKDGILVMLVEKAIKLEDEVGRR